MKKVLSFGAGVQTTALAILIAEGKVKVDEVVFADTGGEKPETYWYMEAYTIPLFKEIGVPFTTVRGEPRNLVEHCEHYRILPMIYKRWCSDHAKIRPINAHIGKEAISIIGFSSDEINRAERARNKAKKSFPLIDMGISASDCQRIISNYGWPLPLKSSCYFCPFQRWPEWNWLKIHHPELIDICLDMESNFYKRRPDLRQTHGVFGGKPLWMWVEGIQREWEFPGEYSCWSGDCGH